MLRRAENARLEYRGGALSSKKGLVTLWVGRKSTLLAGGRKILWTDYQASLQTQMTIPIPLVRWGDRVYWQFQNRIYWDNDGLSRKQVHALLTTRMQREQQKVDRAVAMVTRGVHEPPSRRSVIPDDVKQYVFQRDRGRCVRCGATTEIQYDHIIPIAMGGSNEQQNLQILCGPCNRRKGASLT